MKLFYGDACRGKNSKYSVQYYLWFRASTGDPLWMREDYCIFDR